LSKAKIADWGSVELDADQTRARSTVHHVLTDEDPMTKPATLMVRLAAGIPNDALLLFTADLAHRLKVARVIGISACQPIQIYGSPEAYVPPEFINWDRAWIDKQLKEAEDAFRSALEGKTITVEWRSTVVTYGTIADYVAAEMRGADLLITAAEEAGTVFDRSRHLDVADVTPRVGRPVLIVGSGVDRLDLRSVVVGWKDTREARRATEDALPFLKLAERVTVVEVAADGNLADARLRIEDVVGWLAAHGVTATALAVVAAKDDATTLRTTATKLGAGLLVGGAYGHSRLREWVVGGVTRDVLLRPIGCCSLVSH
jgi:nucleotide-binding universal stress UspA family protein